MSREIEVVFTKDKKGSFSIGQKKLVKPGYAFNYLFPYQFAILNNPENQTKIDAIAKEAEKHSVQLKTLADAAHASIDGKSITFHVKSHDEGRLYGSISINDVVSKLNIDFETSLDKHDIKGFTPIKDLGTYTAYVVIHKDIRSTVSISVEKEKDVEKTSSSLTQSEQSSKRESSVTTYADDDTEVTTPQADDDASSSATHVIDDTIF